MKQNLHQAFKNIKEIEPNLKLEGLVLSKIESLREKQARRKLILSYFSLAISSSFLLLAIFTYGNAFIKSGFWDLLKLVSTDTGLVLGNWIDFSFSLLETFPAVSSAIILIPIFTLLLSFSIYFKSIRKSHYNYA